MSDPVTGHGITQETYEARRTSFGAGAAEYDRVRPEWPADILTWLMGDPRGAVDVLDLGAGTGKGTRALADLGHRVTAVEPSEGMREVLQAGLAGRDVAVLCAHAEDLPLPDDSVDAVVCLQAWHWVDAEVAGPEVARVLRAGGTFGLAWHALDLGEEWVRDLYEIALRPEASRDESDPDEPLEIPGFAPARPERRAYIMSLTPNDLAVQAGSWSHIAIHPERERILEELRRLGASVAGPDGLVRLPHVTTCYRTQVPA
jgi:SAM-dependent methyltransferase